MSQMVDAWGGWSQFQVLLQTLKRIASKHGVSIPTVAVKYILDQVHFQSTCYMVGVQSFLLNIYLKFLSSLRIHTPLFVWSAFVKLFSQLWPDQ